MKGLADFVGNDLHAPAHAADQMQQASASSGAVGRELDRCDDSPLAVVRPLNDIAYRFHRDDYRGSSNPVIPIPGFKEQDARPVSALYNGRPSFHPH